MSPRGVSSSAQTRLPLYNAVLVGMRASVTPRSALVHTDNPFVATKSVGMFFVSCGGAASADPQRSDDRIVFGVKVLGDPFEQRPQHRDLVVTEVRERLGSGLER